MALNGILRQNVLPWQSRPAARLATRLLILAVGAIVAGAAVGGGARAAVPLQLVYRVSHSAIGDLGSYSCTVEPLGNGDSEIRSREHIEVRMLGIPLYRMNASDTERWQGNRLVSLDAVTDNASGRIEVKGAAQGDYFIVTSPQGTLTTAASVHPAEPCAANFLHSTTILRPDTGDLEQVRLSGGEPASVTIDGAPIPARKYVLSGKTRYTVWLDSRNLPVRFVIDDSAGQATFTLAKCISCDTQISRLGTE